MTHPYFVAKAREIFARAGGDPEKSSALAAWAEDARARMDSKHGVLVAEDGTLVARTVWAYSPVREVRYWEACTGAGAHITEV